MTEQITEQTEKRLNSDVKTHEKAENLDIKTTEKTEQSELPEVKLSSKDKKRLRNQKYYTEHKAEILNKKAEKAEKRLKKAEQTGNSDVKTPEKTEIKTSSANSSYIWIIAIIALLSICIFALYVFSHGQSGNTGNMDGLPYY